MDRKQYVVLNGKTSTTCSATSGVPQGSVLGPLLFLIYINDSVDSAVIEGNCITLYADDMLLYKIINNPQDFICVQQGINNVGRSVTGSNLRLNSVKCKTMIVTRRRTRAVPVPELKLYGQALERVFEYKYLGVTLSYNLSWSPHVENIVAKTRRLTGMLYWQLYQWSDPETLLKIYLYVIRPHLEYAAPVWSPDLTKDVNRLEHVQKFALRVCTKEWSMSYKDLLEKSHLPELSTRRDHLSLGLLHKIINAPLLTYSTTYSTCSNVDMSCLLRIPTCSRAHIFIVQYHC